jgi:Nif-specific regulatory protein
MAADTELIARDEPRRNSGGDRLDAGSPRKDPDLDEQNLSPDALKTPEEQSRCGFSRMGVPGELAHSSPGEIQCRVFQELQLLFKISQELQRSLELRDILQPVLEDMWEITGMRRAMITIFNSDTRQTILEEAVGLTQGEKPHDYLTAIQPLIATVQDQNSPVVVRDISQDPHFERQRPKPVRFGNEQHETVSFFCVPICHMNRVKGTLSIERISQGRESSLRLLQLIASLLAQAVSIRQEAHEKLESLRRENERLQERLEHVNQPGNLIGSSGGMRSVYLHIDQVSGSNTTVLIRGESGVGKELVARAIYENSPREGKPFVKVNCAALPDSVIESELFGHEKGAFTGALSMRKGRFELANGGTLFLDEIGDISPAVQVKLLRVMQEKEFERVGGQETLRADVRIITATSRNIEQMMEAEEFRLDLYYRLNVFPIYVPALRDRKSDILQLADHFIEKYNRQMEKNVERISTAAIDALMSYHWPGNVRELENVIERAVLLCRGRAIQAHHLPPTLQKKDRSETQGDKSRGTLQSAVESLEREIIIDTLKDTGSNMAEAARRLGITERKMGLRVKKYGIDPKRFSE